jgi:AAA+ superfamily predicted ATPase
LQDDVTRRRPGVDLALNLLCRTPEERLHQRERFSPGAPLLRHRLLHLIPDPNAAHTPLLAHTLLLDEQMRDLLLGQGGLDARLAAFCQISAPDVALDDLALDPALRASLTTLCRHAQHSGEVLRLYLHGPQGMGQRQIAAGLAAEIGAELLVADLARIPSGAAFDLAVRLVLREAWLQGAVLFLDGLDRLAEVEQWHALLAALADSTGITILAGARPWIAAGGEPLGVLVVPLDLPDYSQRRARWAAELAARGIIPLEGDLDGLAGRYRLTPAQIADAAATVRSRAIWYAAAAREDDPPQPLTTDLFTAARAQSGHELGMLAHKIEPVYTWDDLVLPDDSLAQLHEICQRVAYRHRVLGEWGFDRKLSLGKGVSALFVGASGTGKTMAAEVIANALQLDLYKIDLAGVVSKYIGETEKNLDRIFSAAENANAILFFDEADALFGKRSEVSDSHDRYANIEIAYLLQKIEEYDGIAILATNLRQNLDEAFLRRLAYTVHFPFPDETSRRRIWAGIWPGEVPLAPEMDLDDLARRFRLSGGNIKNAALGAAFLAAAGESPVTTGHVLQAIRREYQKMGKLLSDAELGDLTGAPAVLPNGRQP